MSSLVSAILESCYSFYNSAAFTINYSREVIVGEKDTIRIRDPRNGSGGLGRWFFALELYRHTGDESILGDIIESMGWLEERAASEKTFNYSLFDGRSGLARLWLELYRVTGNGEYRGKALALTKQHAEITGHAFWIQDYSGLAGGMSGILLFYLDLYHATGEEWLYDLIRKYVSILIGRCRLSPTGVCWDIPVYGMEKKTDWAFGNSGIAYALLVVGDYFNDRLLLLTGGKALCHEDAVRKENGQGCALAQDQAGRYLVRLYALAGNGDRRRDGVWQPADGWENIPSDLTCGAAGWGLAYKEAYSLTGNHHYLEEIENIAAILLKRLSCGGEGAERDMSFYHGLTGVCYFLMQTIDPAGPASLLFPRVRRAKGAANNGATPRKAGLGLDGAEINRTLLKHNYRDTVAFLEKRAGEELQKFNTGQLLVTPVVFRDWANRISREKLREDEWEDFDQMADIDVAMNGLGPDVSLLPQKDDMAFAGRIDLLLRMPWEKFIRKQLVISGSTLIFRKEKNIDLYTHLTEQGVRDLFGNYGSQNFLIIPDRFGNPRKMSLGIRCFFADLFMKPAEVGAMKQKVVGFLTGQRDEVIRLFLQYYGAADREDLERRLGETFLNAVRDLVLLGILEEKQGVRPHLPKINHNGTKLSEGHL